MAMSNSEFSKVQADLIALYHAASKIAHWNGKDSWKYIEVGEYPLALDSIACAYLENGITMPSEQFEIFERLATDMELEKDPEYDAVAKLRARPAANAL